MTFPGWLLMPIADKIPDELKFTCWAGDTTIWAGYAFYFVHLVSIMLMRRRLNFLILMAVLIAAVMYEILVLPQFFAAHPPIHP